MARARSVGDPIEARALGRVLSEGRPGDQPCLIGSVKTNIGHLEAGAGIAGLIKVALALYHRRIPGNLHFDRPNPDIDFDALRLRVPTALRAVAGRRRPRPGGGQRLRFRRHQCARRLARGTACDSPERPVSSGGSTRALDDDGPLSARSHQVFIPWGRESCQSRRERRAWLVPLSARGPDALRAMARSWEEFLAGARTMSHSKRSPPTPPFAAPITITAWGSWPTRSKNWRSDSESSPRDRRRRAWQRGEHRPAGRLGSPSSARARGRSGGRWAGNCCTRSRSSAPRSSAATRSCDGSATGRCSTS